MQGLAAGVIGTLGRLHTHKPAAQVAVLDDLRRSPRHEHDRIDEVTRHAGHSHAGGAPLRHHHAGGV